MKLFLLSALALTIGTTAVNALPTVEQPTPTWYRVGENNIGPVYSNTPPAKRSAPSWYQVGENEHGPVYSSVDPAVVSRDIASLPSEVIDEYNTWITQNSLPKNSTTVLATRGNDPIEKRDALFDFTVCVINCGLGISQANGAMDTPQLRVRFCLARCLVTVGAVAGLKDAYLRRYGDQSFPPPPY